MKWSSLDQFLFIKISWMREGGLEADKVLRRDNPTFGKIFWRVSIKLNTFSSGQTNWVSENINWNFRVRFFSSISEFQFEYPLYWGLVEMKQLAGFKEWLTWQKAAPYCGNRTGPPRGGRPDRIFGRNFLPTSLSVPIHQSGCLVKS